MIYEKGYHFGYVKFPGGVIKVFVVDLGFKNKKHKNYLLGCPRKLANG